MKDEGIIDSYITKAENERTAMAKQDCKDARRVTIDTAHSDYHQAISKPQFIQQVMNVGYVLATTVCKLVHNFTNNNQQVRSRHKPTVIRFHNEEEPIIITYDSDADNHYVSEAERIKLKLPILRPSHKRTAVANGGTSEGKYVTRILFPQLSTISAEADTFEEFSSSLMSVGKTSNDENVYIFTHGKVQVYKGADVLITYRSKPIFIGKQDEHRRYRIPLMQTRGHWRPHTSTKQSKKPTSYMICQL